MAGNEIRHSLYFLVHAAKPDLFKIIELCVTNAEVSDISRLVQIMEWTAKVS